MHFSNFGFSQKNSFEIPIISLFKPKMGILTFFLVITIENEGNPAWRFTRIEKLTKELKINYIGTRMV